MDGGAWWATVHGVAESGTRLSDFTHSLTHRGLSDRLPNKRGAARDSGDNRGNCLILIVLTGTRNFNSTL